LDKKASPVNRIISLYREEPARLNIRVTAIYLYGSYARDNNREGSDIDLVVVSPDFAGFNMRERLELLGLAAARILEPIQAYGFTAEEIKPPALSPFWADILKHEAIPI
jgi:predicted nucleotidyltransferase